MGLSTKNYANIAAFIFNMVVAAAIGFGLVGESNEFVSAKYQTIITPASWAFAIWGVIFPAELAFVVVQCLPSARDSELVTSGVAWGWASTALFQSLWQLTFAQEQALVSTVFLFIAWASLGGIVKRSAGAAPLDSRAADLLCRIPFAIHFAWLAAACSLNVSVVVVQGGGSVSDQLAAGLTCLALVLVLATQCAARPFVGRSVAAGVAAWALAAIASELSTPMDAAQCAAAGVPNDECNMISDLFDEETIVGVQKTVLALSVVSVVTVVLGAVAAPAPRFAAAAAAAAASAKSLPVPSSATTTTMMEVPLL